PPARWACRWSSAAPRPPRWRRWPTHWGTHRAGSSSTGRGTRPWPPAWSGAPSGRASRRWWWRWTPPPLGWRGRDLQLARLPFAHGQGLANYLSAPAFRAALPESPERDPAAAVRHFLAVVCNAALTWDDLDWLRRQTRLPILLKGLLHPGDALE